MQSVYRHQHAKSLLSDNNQVGICLLPCYRFLFPVALLVFRCHLRWFLMGSLCRTAHWAPWLPNHRVPSHWSSASGDALLVRLSGALLSLTTSLSFLSSPLPTLAKKKHSVQQSRFSWKIFFSASFPESLRNLQLWIHVCGTSNDVVSLAESGILQWLDVWALWSEALGFEFSLTTP